MSEYTKPELSDFRDSWACEHVRAEVPAEARLQEWDEMLAEVERAAAEKAWDASLADRFMQIGGAALELNQARARNPYRKAATNA